MSIEEQDLVLTPQDIAKIQDLLKNVKFEDLKINPYFWRSKFTGNISSQPRHDIALPEVKRIYEQRTLIQRGFKRKSNAGYCYTLCYQESKNVFMKIGLILDKNPPELFMAMRIYRKLEGSVLRRYGVSFS